MKKILLILTVFISFNGFSQLKELTLKDAVLPSSVGLTPENLQSLQWIDDTNNYIYKSDNRYIIKDVGGKTIQTIGEELAGIMSDADLPSIYSISKTELIVIDGNAYIHYDYHNKKVLKTIQFDVSAKNRDYHKDKQAVTYTIDNNLCVALSSNPKIKVTANTDKNIVSGQAIHRYEFGISKGTFWSPQGNYLAFYQKDETNVTDYPLVDITTYPASLKNIKYPMAGQKSEQAKIGVYNVAANKTIYLNIDTRDEHYLTNLSWTPDEKYVLVAEVNRAQNHFKFNRYDVATGEKVNTIFEEKNDRWVEPEHDAVFLPNSTTDFLWMSERDGFMNLYHYNIEGKLIKQVTDYDFVIKSILGFDKKGQHVFINATGEDPKNTLTFSVNLTSGKSTIITKTEGVHYTQLSSDGSYLIDNFSNLTIPRQIDIVNTVKVTSSTILKAENPLKNYKIGETELLRVSLKNAPSLECRLIKPANFDETKKYPVLIYVYGGTHAQLVTNDWLGGASLWMHWLATQKDYLVFTLDNRGSENRGFEFESVIHRKAGEAAMEDQLAGVEYLKSLPYVDANRMVVHGWSYGGFMASSLMLRHPKVFKAAAAGGPVTDWKYYEIMYGERYMDTPQENPEGYEKSRVGNYLENLDGKLLLIHGSVDPTVVPQHSMTLLKEAVEKEIQLDFFTYPMHEHNVRGKDRVHLMTKILDYLVEYNK